ncbi:MAG: hypothetical protein ACRDQ5_15915 [Sciscionella sp.]
MNSAPGFVDLVLVVVGVVVLLLCALASLLHELDMPASRHRTARTDDSHYLPGVTGVHRIDGTVVLALVLYFGPVAWAFGWVALDSWRTWRRGHQHPPAVTDPPHVRLSQP